MKKVIASLLFTAALVFTNGMLIAGDHSADQKKSCCKSSCCKEGNSCCKKADSSSQQPK